MLFCFFQAKDGIRDTSVTGVQTCALPICGLSNGPSDEYSTELLRNAEQKQRVALATEKLASHPHIASWREAYRSFGRSEERRVGKEERGRRVGGVSEKKKSGHEVKIADKW